MNIYQIGHFPPPFGGVSIHIHRLHENLLLEKSNSFVIDVSNIKKEDSRVYNYGKYRWVPILLIKRTGILHFHNCNFFLYLAIFILGLRHKTILSVHNPRYFEHYLSSNWLKRNIYRLLLKRLDVIIINNNVTFEKGKTLLPKYKNFHVIPEFLPPAHIPPLENEIIKSMRINHKIILSSCASQVCWYNNQDLYGIDQLIDLTFALKYEHNLDIGFIFLLPNINDYNYYNFLLEKIKSKNLHDIFVFITEPIQEASSLWKISDIVIRATNTDGNPLTVLEALSLNVCVLASDCTDRMPMVKIFQTRNFTSLLEETLKIIYTLDNPREKKTIPNNFVDYLAIYNSFQCFSA